MRTILGAMIVAAMFVVTSASAQGAPPATRPADRGQLDRQVAGAHVPLMVLIPAGEFQMGNCFDGEGYPDELPGHAVEVGAFYMDQTEVTNQQYADALNRTVNQSNPLIAIKDGRIYKYNSGKNDPYCDENYPYCDTTASSPYSRITWNGTRFGVTAGKENHPMVRVSWYGAVAYCNWRSAMQSRPPGYDLSTWSCKFGDSYRLPTEAEWEKAARGGASGHRYGWSDVDTIEHGRANYCSDPCFPYDTSSTRLYHPAFTSKDWPYTSPVGSFAANGFGLYDMVGNVWEWCNDWYDSKYYGTEPSTRVNPRGPASGSMRVLRGGCWFDDALWCRVAYRGGSGPAYGIHVFGFRCVSRTP
jgi:formylglycine-generating enzyme required for sulfatase activity